MGLFLHLDRSRFVVECIHVPAMPLFDRVGDIAARNCRPSTDKRGSADYKTHLAKVLSSRALARSVSRALGQEA